MNKVFASAVLTAAVLVSQAFADTINMNDGQIIEKATVSKIGVREIEYTLDKRKKVVYAVNKADVAQIKFKDGSIEAFPIVEKRRGWKDGEFRKGDGPGRPHRGGPGGFRGREEFGDYPERDGLPPPPERSSGRAVNPGEGSAEVAPPPPPQGHTVTPPPAPPVQGHTVTPPPPPASPAVTPPPAQPAPAQPAKAQPAPAPAAPAAAPAQPAPAQPAKAQPAPAQAAPAAAPAQPAPAQPAKTQPAPAPAAPAAAPAQPAKTQPAPAPAAPAQPAPQPAK